MGMFINQIFLTFEYSAQGLMFISVVSFPGHTNTHTHTQTRRGINFKGGSCLDYPFIIFICFVIFSGVFFVLIFFIFISFCCVRYFYYYYFIFFFSKINKNNSLSFKCVAFGRGIFPTFSFLYKYNIFYNLVRFMIIIQTTNTPKSSFIYYSNTTTPHTSLLP